MALLQSGSGQNVISGLTFPWLFFKRGGGGGRRREKEEGWLDGGTLGPADRHVGIWILPIRLTLYPYMSRIHVVTKVP